MGKGSQALALACVAAIVLQAFVTQVAYACSVTDDYVRPTNFELVQITDAIVVATAMRAIKSEPVGAVEFRVDKTLKGPAPKTFTGAFAYLGKPRLGDPNDIGMSHPEGHAGACNRTTFAKGKQYVMFLNKGDKGEFHAGGPAFSRVNEDYFGDDSLWVRTIRTYLDIQRMYGPMEQLAVLEALLQEKLKGQKTPTREAEARDILDHLRSRSPWKPTEYLVQTFETLERGEEPKYGVRSRAADRENSDAQDLTDLLTGQDRPPDKMSRADEMYFVLRSLVLGEHRGASPLFDRLLSVARVPPRTLGLGIRFYAKNGQYRRAYGLIESRAVVVLTTAQRDDALQLVANIYAAQRGDDYGDRKERWRSDPYVAAEWPEFDLGLYWLQVRMFGEQHTLGGDAAREIPIVDYRARPLLTLARRYDQKAEAWAIQQVLDEKARKAWEAKKEEDRYNKEDPAWLPIAVLVRGYGDERAAALTRVACQGSSRRLALIAALGQWGDSLAVAWLARIAATPGLPDEEREELAKAAARLFARETADGTASLFGSLAGRSEYELLEQIIGRKEITDIGEKVAPLRCPS